MEQLLEMEKSISEANYVLKYADKVAAQIGRLLIGRLKHCSNHTLKALKKELRDYNMHTGEWKE